MVLTKACKACGSVKPLSEFNKNPKSGDRLQRLCKPCHSAQTRSYYVPRPRPTLTEEERATRYLASQKRYKERMGDLLPIKRREWAERNRARIKVSQREKYLRNRAMIQAATKAYAQSNPDQTRAYKRKWERLNPGKANAKTARRYAAKVKATPVWRNDFFIEEIYDLAAKRTAITGIEWQVDHIVPLRSPAVCGLHVEHNLRVIPAPLNQQKNNRHWPDMP